MNRKSQRVVAILDVFQREGVNSHYLGFLDFFNRGRFFEAHEVLEDLWLQDRSGPDASFFKGLIQLAGAFVHVQKRRLGPAKALLRLAEGNLRGYPGKHLFLDVVRVRSLIGEWLTRLENRGLPSADAPLPALAVPAEWEAARLPSACARGSR